MTFTLSLRILTSEFDGEGPTGLTKGEILGLEESLLVPRTVERRAAAARKIQSVGERDHNRAAVRRGVCVFAARSDRLASHCARWYQQRQAVSYR